VSETPPFNLQLHQHLSNVAEPHHFDPVLVTASREESDAVSVSTPILEIFCKLKK
jgi:hypothetical protein